MSCLTLAFAVVLGCLVPMETEKAALQGSWELFGSEQRGFPLDDFNPLGSPYSNLLRLTFIGDHFVEQRGHGETDKETGKLSLSWSVGDIHDYSLNPLTKMKQFNFAGSDGYYKKLPTLGIYERDGNYLKICYGVPGKGKRPTRFTGDEGSGYVFLIFKRCPD